MLFTTITDRAKALMLAAGFSLALALPAFAQSPQAEDDQEATTEEASAPSVNDEDVLKDIASTSSTGARSISTPQR